MADSPRTMTADVNTDAGRSASGWPWYILGAGAIGGLFAARLQAGGVPVDIVLRDAAQRDGFPKRGIDIRNPNGTPAFSAMPGQCPTAVAAGELAPHSIRQLLVATKAHQTADALQPLSAALHPDAVIVLLQNGMGVAEAVRPLLPATIELMHALTTDGVWRSGRFELVYAGRGQTHIGPMASNTPSACQRAEGIAAQWRHAGIDTHAEANIATRIWRKLAVNCAINPFAALYRCSNGELSQHREWLPRRRRVLDEIDQLAQALGLGDVLRDIDEEVDRVVAATAANRCSMLQDVLAQRTTEIDFLNGFVAARSTSLGLPAPENTELATAVAALPAVR